MDLRPEGTESTDPVNDFLRPIFGDQTPEVWVTACTDTTAPGAWTGCRLKDARWADADPDQNFYFCIGLLGPDAKRRETSAIVRHYIIVADDIGTKVSKDKWDAMFAMGFPWPTYFIETSPGNWSYYWTLDKPIDADDKTAVEALYLVRETLITRGLTDAIQDDARYMRLPVGLNSKEKYRNAEGRSPGVRLGPDSDSSRRLSVAQAADILHGTDWRAHLDAGDIGGKLVAGAGNSTGNGTLVRCADMNNPEPIMLLAQELGMNPVQTRVGVVEALCPNAGKHSDRPDSGFAFLGNGLMHCNHGSCLDTLRTPDFKRMMDDRYDIEVGLGMHPGLPPSAEEFLAGKVFSVEDNAASGPGSAGAELAQQIETTEANGTAATARKELQFTADLDGLAQQFVYVQSAGRFYNTVERREYKTEDFEGHPAVRRVIPVGATGMKRARNQFLNHPGTVTCETFAYLPGDHSAAVKMADKNGREFLVANTWRAPRLPVLTGKPKVWLRQMRFIYDTPDALHFILCWLAYVIQNPQGRTSIVPTTYGKQGCGKDAIWSPIYTILGEENVIPKLTKAIMMHPFNDYMECRLMMMPELRLTDRESYEAFKEITSVDPRPVRINKKHQQPYNIKGMHVVAAMTNNLDAIANMDPDDRRVWFFKSGAERTNTRGDKDTPGSEAYFEYITPILQSIDEAARVLNFLMNYDYTGFDPFAEAPDPSGHKHEMLVDTLPAAGHWAYDSVMPGGHFAGRTLLTLHEVEVAATAQGGPSVTRYLTGRALRDGLAAADWVSLGQCGSSSGPRLTLWRPKVLPKERDDEIKNTPKAGLIQLYDQDRDQWLAGALAGTFSEPPQGLNPP